MIELAITGAADAEETMQLTAQRNGQRLAQLSIENLGESDIKRSALAAIVLAQKRRETVIDV